MTRKEQIKNAYKLTGGNASFYDGMMTYSTLAGKAICRAVWKIDFMLLFMFLMVITRVYAPFDQALALIAERAFRPDALSAIRLYEVENMSGNGE